MKNISSREFLETYGVFLCFFGIILIVTLISYLDIKNHFYVERDFLRCSYGEYIQSSKDFEFECKKFDLVHIDKVKADLSDKENLAKINEHCIKFSEYGRCVTLVTNYNSSEFKKILEGETITKSDLLGYLK